MCHDSFHATLIWDMTHSYVTCGIAGRTYSTNTAVRGFPLQHHLNEPCHTWMSHVMCECVISHMKEWVMSRVNASCHIWKNESHRNEASHVTLTVRIQLCADSHCNTCLTLALHVSTRAPAQGVWRHDSFTYADSCRFVRTLSDVPCITFALHRAPAQSA